MCEVVKNAQEGILGLRDGAVIMFGGFGLCGIPENCIEAIAKTEIKNLLCISNNAGMENEGLGLLIKNHQIKKMISTYIGENKEIERQILAKSIEVELISTGTFAEKIRAAGIGIPAFYVRTGFGTELAEGKELKEFNGKMYLMEHALTAEIAFVKAWKGDTSGNLIYKGTAMNFNPLMAMAADITVAEVEELVPEGDLDPNQVHTQGIFVQRIFQRTQ